MKKLTLSLLLLLYFVLSYGQGLVWYENAPTKVLTSDFDMADIVDITPDTIGPIRGIALDLLGGHIYLCYLGNSIVSPGILRMNLDGSNVIRILTDLDTPVGIAVDLEGEKLYWIEHYGIVIKKADLDGTNIETLVNVGGYAVETIHLSLDNGNNRIYFNKPNDRGLFYVNLDETTVKELYEPGVVDRCFALEAIPSRAKLYYLHTSYAGLRKSTISRINLDGTNPELLMEFQNDFTSTSIYDLENLTIDTTSSEIYFAYRGASRIGKVNIDGTMSREIYRSAGRIGQIQIAHEVPTGLEEYDLSLAYQTTVFPNPVKDVLHIVTKEPTIRSFSLYDATGTLITQRGFGNQTKFAIDMKSLRQGVYFLRLDFENRQSQARKVIKQ